MTLSSNLGSRVARRFAGLLRVPFLPTKLHSEWVWVPEERWPGFSAELEDETVAYFRTTLEAGHTVVNLASDRGLLSAFVSPLVGDFGQVYCLQTSPAILQRYQNIHAIELKESVDALIEENGISPNIIYVHLEGMECRLLRSSFRTLMKHPQCRWVISVDPRKLLSVGEKETTLFDIFDEFGYELKKIVEKVDSRYTFIAQRVPQSGPPSYRL